VIEASLDVKTLEDGKVAGHDQIQPEMVEASTRKKNISQSRVF